jgi:hypothetical protein
MKTKVTALCVVALFFLPAACGPGGAGDKVIKSGKVGELTVTLSSDDGVLRHGRDEFLLKFANASGNPVEVGAASLNFHMPAMGTMPVMNDAATLTTTDTPGVYRGKVNLQMAGEWQAQVAYEGPAGQGKGSFPVTAQ